MTGLCHELRGWLVAQIIFKQFGCNGNVSVTLLGFCGYAYVFIFISICVYICRNLERGEGVYLFVESRMVECSEYYVKLIVYTVISKAI